MLRRSPAHLVRLPSSRRPRGTAWSYTAQSGSVEKLPKGAWHFPTLLMSTFVGHEAYQYWQRLRVRGDTCESCETAREHYRDRLRRSAEAHLAATRIPER